MTHFEPLSAPAICSSKPHCGLGVNSLNIMKIQLLHLMDPLLLFPAFHTPDCSIQSP